MADALKPYPTSWEGELVLACRKCQKKLKSHKDRGALASLKRTVKRFNKEHPDKLLHVINVPCMDLCPKDGVTVCCPERDGKHLLIMRSPHDIERLAS